MAEERSLRDELQASFETLSTADETPQDVAEDGSNGAQGAPAAEVAGAAAPEAAAAPTAEETQAAADAARDEKGRFKAKTETPAAEGAQAAAPQAPNPETVKPAGEEPQSEAIRVPPSLPAAIKAKFATLDPDVRSAFVALEESVQTAKAEWGSKGQRLNRFDEIIGARREQFALRGIDEFQAIQTLFAAQDILDRNPVAGLIEVARSYGVTPAHLAQAFGLSQASGQQPGQEGQAAPTGAPDLQAALQQHLAPVLTQVQTLQQRLDQTAQQSEAAEINRLAAQIQEFASKPENMYFDNVSDAVVEHAQRLKASGQPVTMDLIKDAYDRATWADPTIRPLLQAAQNKAAEQEAARKADEQRKAKEQADRTKAQAAGHASGSVTGSPAPNSGAPRAAQGSVRDALKAALEEHGAL